MADVLRKRLLSSKSSSNSGQVPSAKPSRPSLDSESASSNPGPTAPTNAFYRRKSPKASQVATSQSTLQSSIHKTKSSSSSRRSKKAIFSGVIRKVVPCVGPSAYHPPTLDAPDLRPSNPDAFQGSQNNGGTSTPKRQPTPIPVPTDVDMEDADIILAPPPSAKLLPEEETEGVTSGAVQPPGSSIRFHEIAKPAGEESDGMLTDEEPEFYEDDITREERLIKAGGNGYPIGPDGKPCPLLPPLSAEHQGRKCLVLDLDETLVHSSFKPIPSPDFIVPVEIESSWHHFHVLKRPGVDEFLREMGEHYEIVVFTASLSKYADPVLDKLDIHNVVTHRLFRESCYSHRGNYVKDLSQLGRPIESTIIMDNSPASYIFHTHNAVPVSSWFNDPHDAELTDLVPFLKDLTDVEDVTVILDGAR